MRIVNHQMRLSGTKSGIKTGAKTGVKPRIWSISTIAVAAMLVLATGQSGQAQTGPGASSFGDGMLPVRDILSIVFEQGFEPLSNPVRQGKYYVLLAVDEAQGIEMRLLVDGGTGDVLRARPRGFDPPGSVQAAVPRAGAPHSGSLERRAALPSSSAIRAATPTPRPRPVATRTPASSDDGDQKRTLAPAAPLVPLAKTPAAESAETTGSTGVSGQDKKGTGIAFPPVTPLE